MKNRKPMKNKELSKLDVYSDFQSNVVNILISHGKNMSKKARIALEDTLIEAITPKDHQHEFITMTMLAVAAPRLIDAVEKEWLGGRVFKLPTQNPESLGVDFALVFLNEQERSITSSLSKNVLDENNKIRHDL